MHPTPNVMSQDSGSPNRLRGNSERVFTAVVQLVCGFIAVVCGLVLVIFKNPNDDFNGYQIDRFGKTAFGIWGGLVFVATAIPYLFGRYRKSMVGLYLGFCLASSVIAVVGLGLSITAINKIVYTRTDTSICKDGDLEIYGKGLYHCCFELYQYTYDCRAPYYDYSLYDYHRPTDDPRPLYDSMECGSFRSMLRSSYEECFQELKRLYVPHLAFYGILISVVSVELFASIFGACASLSALCNCCVGGEPTHNYPCSLNQLMVNDSLNNTVNPPPVTTEQSEPADI